MKMGGRLLFAGLAAFTIALGGGAALAAPGKGEGRVPPNRFRTLLESRNFAELNRILGGLQEAFEKDGSREEGVQEAFDSFAVARLDWEPLLDQWAQSFPRAWQPRMAKASYYVRMGYHARGTRWARETTEAQFGSMRRYLARAKEEARRALELNPRLMVAYLALIEESRAYGLVEEEASLVEKALAIHPASFAAREAYLSATIPRWGGSYPEMDRFARAAQAHAGANPSMRFLLGASAHDRAYVAMLEDKVDLAVTESTSALSHGDYPPYLLFRARCYLQQGDLEKAGKDVSRCLEVAPDYPPALLLVARVTMAAKRWEEALLIVEKFLQDDREAADPYLLKSEIHLGMGRQRDATRDIQRALELDPGNPEVGEARDQMAALYLAIGGALLQEKEAKKALEQCDFALKLDGESTRAMALRAACYRALGMEERALFDLERARSLAPDDLELSRSLDEIYSRRKAWAKVEALWTDYLQVDPGAGYPYYRRSKAHHAMGERNAARADALMASQRSGEFESWYRSLRGEP